MVAMAASKENPSCSSSSSSASAYRTLRTPLSPLHHNSSAVRHAEHSTPVKASRCCAANPARALLPPLGIKSPPHPTRNLPLPGSPNPAYRTFLPPHGIKSPPHLSRNLSLPRSPNPVSAGRKLSRDGVANLDLTTRFKPPAPKEKDRIPAATPRSKSFIPLNNTRQSKRQTQLFVQQKATVEPFAGDKVGSFSQKQVHQTESENSERPCRKKWRRFPRESVLRSLRGEKAQEGLLGLATTGMEKPHRDANPCSKPKEVEPLQIHRLNVGEPPLRELSFDVYADGTFAKNNHSLVSGSQSVSQVSAKNEGAEQETIALSGHGAQTCSQVSENRAEEECLTVCLPGENSPNHAPNDNLSLTLTSPNCTLNKSLSLTITPPAQKSLPLADKNLTPPMQSTQSPDFIKREGVRGLLPIEGTCFAAPCALVKDRRKCKPRGVLTVDAGHETLSSVESEPGLDLNQSVQQIPTPAVASVEWMLEEKRTLGGDASPQLVEASTDLCRMSFPSLSPCHLESSSAQHKELRTCSNVEDEAKSQQGSILQASLSFSGYEWGASSSQGPFSSCRTEASSANPRRSIVFDDDDIDRSEHASAKFKSKIMDNILYEEIPEISSMDFSDEESDECLGLRGVIPSEGSPPFEYSLFSSLKVEESSEISNQKAWPKCLQEEMLSMSGPMDSLMSSPDGEADFHSIALTGSNYAGPLVPFQGGKSSRNRDCQPLDLAPELHHGSADISSRLAMAEYLCKITATYLEDIATSLGKDQIDVDATNVCVENMDNLSLEHSSIVEGRKKMAECCSLLRGLTLETSKSKENSRLSSECSVNQPSPSSVEDSADSSVAHLRPKGRRSQELLSLQFSSWQDDSIKAPQTWNSCKTSPNGLRAPSRRNHAKAKFCLPSRRFVAGAYLLAGLFVISHTYHKHVKQSRQLNEASTYVRSARRMLPSVQGSD